MASNKAFLLLALLVALVLVVAASGDLAPTSSVKENGKASVVGGVDDVKQLCHNSPCCYNQNGDLDCTCLPRTRCPSCCRPDEAVDSAEP